MLLLWLKAFHIIFAVTWFAGLFYLPRLFVYHVGTTDAQSLARFAVMERRLFGIMTIGAALTVLFAVSMLVTAPGYLMAGWLHVKLTLVLLLVAYLLFCGRLMRALAAGRNTYSARWYRMFNEVPALLLIGIVVLAVVKPF
jgi:putative membrane protein